MHKISTDFIWFFRDLFLYKVGCVEIWICEYLSMCIYVDDFDRIYEIRCDINVKLSKDFLNIFHFLMFFLAVNTKMYLSKCYRIVCQTNIIHISFKNMKTLLFLRDTQYLGILVYHKLIARSFFLILLIIIT